MDVTPYSLTCSETARFLDVNGGGLARYSGLRFWVAVVAAGASA